MFREGGGGCCPTFQWQRLVASQCDIHHLLGLVVTARSVLRRRRRRERVVVHHSAATTLMSWRRGNGLGLLIHGVKECLWTTQALAQISNNNNNDREKKRRKGRSVQMRTAVCVCVCWQAVTYLGSSDFPGNKTRHRLSLCVLHCVTSGK